MLDPDYIPLTPLWETHTDKDTTELLSDGYALFFRDTARTVGKPVYQLTGSPPNYSYIQQGFLNTDGSWQVNLNDQGAFSQVLYGYPLDSNGNVDLYFIQFYNNDGVFQFSREGWPNYTASTPEQTSVSVNYVPNGQFRLHIDIPETETLDAGQISQPITNIAYGGWTFDRPSSSTATDYVTFQRIGSYVENTDKSPRYCLRVKCENPSSGDQYKDVRIKFDDVNKFSSDVNQYTYAITGQVVSGGNINIDLIIIKNFGTGGDSATEKNIGTFNITSSFTISFESFVFGSNTDNSIGQNDDDYLQIALRFPNSIFDVQFTDVILTDGNISNPIFQDTTTREFIYRSIFEQLVPASDGSDIGLTPILTKTGLTYDTSIVGKIYASSYSGNEFGELLCDGSQYLTSGYSSDGIPYSRLQKKYFNPTKGVPLWGTGKNFVTTYFTNIESGQNASLRIQNNSVGNAANFSDGTPATGFTFNNVSSGTDSASLGLYYGGSSFFIWGTVPGALNNEGPSPGTSGFSMSTIRNGDPTRTNILTKLIFSVQTIAASGLAGRYFSYNNSVTGFTVWFKVDGAGSAPSPPPGTSLIEIDLLSTWTSNEVAKVIAATISGSKVSNIICVAGNVIPVGSYWNLNTAIQEYYVWYTVDGNGTDPAPSGRIGIEVDVLSTDSASQVASKTLIAINSTYYAVPDLRGMFLRGVDNSGKIDTDYLKRWSFYNQTISADQGDLTASFEFDQIAQLELGNTYNGGDLVAGSVSPPYPPLPVDPFGGYTTGGSESRPLNAAINWVVKY